MLIEAVGKSGPQHMDKRKNSSAHNKVNAIYHGQCEQHCPCNSVSAIYALSNE